MSTEYTYLRSPVPRHMDDVTRYGSDSGVRIETHDVRLTGYFAVPPHFRSDFAPEHSLSGARILEHYATAVQELA